MRFIGHAFGLAWASLVAVGCDATFTCEELRRCPPSPPDGGRPAPGADGASEDAPLGRVDARAEGGDGSACDVTRTPDEEGCLVSDEHAVFVAAGSTDGDGSKGAPLGTISEGVAAAAERGVRRVIVCNATYAEVVTLGATDAAVGVFGGFTCPGDGGAWGYAGGARARVTAPSTTALRVDGVSERVTIQDIDFVAADAVDPGTSSIAAVVAGSSEVVFRRVAITAGAGAAGTSGDVGVAGQSAAPSTSKQNGQAPACDGTSTLPGGVRALVSACGSEGGTGGSAILNAMGSGGGRGLPGATSNGGNAASVAGATFPGGTGRPGVAGAHGDPGAAAATIGTFTAGGFTPASGEGGTDGATGQGGGGGGASRGAGACTGASGGAGGQGGCGGARGTGGGGGGASVALLSWDSSVVLIDVELRAGAGGGGGDGGFAGVGGSGASGGSGGPAAAAAGIGPGGVGGAGGPGGNGGAGSGGSGGPSFAIVFRGAAVSVEGGTVLTPARGGTRGAGGAVTGRPDVGVAPNGTVGASAESYEQK